MIIHTGYCTVQLAEDLFFLCRLGSPAKSPPGICQWVATRSSPLTSERALDDLVTSPSPMDAKASLPPADRRPVLSAVVDVLLMLDVAWVLLLVTEGGRSFRKTTLGLGCCCSCDGLTGRDVDDDCPGSGEVTFFLLNGAMSLYAVGGWPGLGGGGGDCIGGGRSILLLGVLCST